MILVEQGELFAPEGRMNLGLRLGNVLCRPAQNTVFLVNEHALTSATQVLHVLVILFLHLLHVPLCVQFRIISISEEQAGWFRYHFVSSRRFLHKYGLFSLFPVFLFIFLLLFLINEFLLLIRHVFIHDATTTPVILTLTGADVRWVVYARVLQMLTDREAHCSPHTHGNFFERLAFYFLSQLLLKVWFFSRFFCRSRIRQEGSLAPSWWLWVELGYFLIYMLSVFHVFFIAKFELNACRIGDNRAIFSWLICQILPQVQQILHLLRRLICSLLFYPLGRLTVVPILPTIFPQSRVNQFHLLIKWFHAGGAREFSLLIKQLANLFPLNLHGTLEHFIVAIVQGFVLYQLPFCFFLLFCLYFCNKVSLLFLRFLLQSALPLLLALQVLARPLHELDRVHRDSKQAGGATTAWRV